MANKPLKKLASDSLELPTERSIPCKDLRDFIIFIYGREKIGKTSLCAQFPDALFLMFEPGAKALSIFKKEVYTWTDFKAIIGKLRDDERFSTVVIDTVDLCYRLCLEYVTKFKLAGTHPSEAGYGKGWDALTDEFQKTMAELGKTGKGVILLSHEVEREIKAKGGTYEIIGPTLSNFARKIVEPMVDIFAYYYFDENSARKLKIVGDSDTIGGNRVQEDGFFKGVSEIDMGRSAKEGYENFVAAFNNKTRPQASNKVLPRKGNK